MSYILEALKKAEAERRQEPLPGLHTQPLGLPPATQRRSAWSHPLAWSSAAALIAIMLGLLWWQPWQPATFTSVPAPAAPSTAPAPQTAAPAVPPVAIAPSDDGAPLDAPQPAALPPVAPQVVTPLPVTPLPAAPVRRSERPAVQDAASPAKTEAAAAQPKPVKPTASSSALLKKAPDAQPAPRPTAPSAVAAKEPEEPIATLRELPEAVQRAIPPLQVEGYIYAEKPSGRSVLINRRLLREGDQVAPDLRLEKMTPGGMVFNYKGYRFRTSY